MKTQRSTTIANQNRLPSMGIDIGRVIISGEHHPNGSDTSFFSGNDQQLFATPMVPGAFETIAELVAHYGGRAWLVSKCGPNVAARSMRWLDHHGFWAITGVSRESVRFCKERRQKAGIAQELALTHFIDDKPDVIASLAGIVEHRYLFGAQTRPVPSGAHHTLDWPSVMRTIEAIGSAGIFGAER
jgi:hypothetical protein